jgi:uncharacterized membrane protein
MLNSFQKRCHILASTSLVALIVLCIAWEWVLAPLRPGGTLMVLKVLPLLFPLPGVLKANNYTLQWSSMLILLYFAEGVVRAMTDTGLSAVLGGIEIVLSAVFFASVLAFLRPFKQEAKRRRKQQAEKAAE